MSTAVALKVATVIQPSKGFCKEEPITTLDFASLYHIFMMAHKLWANRNEVDVLLMSCHLHVTTTNDETAVAKGGAETTWRRKLLV